MSDQDVNPAGVDSVLSYEPAPVVRPEHAEGPLTRVIEQQSAKLPSNTFLFGALGAMAGAVALDLAGYPRLSRYFAVWAPAILTMGVYNKVVKLLGPR